MNGNTQIDVQKKKKRLVKNEADESMFNMFFTGNRERMRIDIMHTGEFMVGNTSNASRRSLDIDLDHEKVATPAFYGGMGWVWITTTWLQRRRHEKATGGQRRFETEILLKREALSNMPPIERR